MRLHHALLTSALTAAVAGPACAGFTLTNSTPGLFDFSSGTRTITVSGAETGFSSTVSDLNVRIDFEKFDGPSLGVNEGGTPFYNELAFILTSPANESVTLIGINSFISGFGGVRGVINFDQQAASAVNVTPTTPQAGSFRPIGDLNNYNSDSTLGTWTLFIQDAAPSDHLGFYSVSLDFNGGAAASTDVPEPSTLMLGLFALGVLPVARRIRRAK